MTKQVVLITGALTGIGRATALAFARDGAQVVVSGRRDDAMKTISARWSIRRSSASAAWTRLSCRSGSEGPGFGRSA